MRTFLITLFALLGVLSTPTLAQVAPTTPPEILDLLTPAQGDAILTWNASGGVIIDGVTHPFELIDFEMVEDDEGEQIPALIGVFDNETGFVVLPINIEEEELIGVVILVLKDEPLVDEEAVIYELDADDEEARLGVSGSVVNAAGEHMTYALALEVGAGTSTFRLDDDTVYLNGDLGSGTYAQVEYLIKAHPEVTRIVFEDVPGSVNDEINVQTGRLIRNAGYTTELLTDSQISSGGVDLFLAGKSRIIAQGAKIGVHSWGDPIGGTKPAELAREDPAHKHQIDYFSAIMDNGVDFYFYTLNAAEFDDIHWMSDEEIQHWKLAAE